MQSSNKHKNMEKTIVEEKVEKENFECRVRSGLLLQAFLRHIVDHA